MLLGVIPMIFFLILSEFWRKSQNGKLDKHGFLRHRVGCPRRGEAGVPKWHPLGYATA